MGLKYVGSSEIDKFANETYRANFKEVNQLGDITKVDPKSVPDCDLITAGFPCQSFSNAGKRLGFKDTRGSLFFNLLEIIKAKKPSVILLENVPGLTTLDKGATYKEILHRLTDAGYFVKSEILDASQFGLAQKRRRLFFVGFRNHLHYRNFHFPKGSDRSKTLKDILETSVDKKYLISDEAKKKLKLRKQVAREYFIKKGQKPGTRRGFTYIIRGEDERSCTLLKTRDCLVRNLIRVGEIGKGGQGQRLYSISGLSPSLMSNSASGTKAGFYDIDQSIRKLTPRECFRLQGFPDSFKFPEDISDSRLYNLIGNSVPVPVVKAIMENIHTAQLTEKETGS